MKPPLSRPIEGGKIHLKPPVPTDFHLLTKSTFFLNGQTIQLPLPKIQWAPFTPGTYTGISIELQLPRYLEVR